VTPEFSRPERLDSIGERNRDVTIVATPAECAALAKRFELRAIDRLEARFALRREAGSVVARGHVHAAVTQACVVTDAPVPAVIDAAVALRFVDAAAPAQDEVELAEDDLDTLPIEHGAIDLGEAAAETLALELDPFPRAPDAAAALKQAGVLSEEEARPKGALAGLKAALEAKDQG
jgi:uncharacterized metal-binding protein YceD (DUF177 family)